MFAAETVSYSHTGSFSKIILDYLSGADRLRPFYDAPPTLEGIAKKIEERRTFGTQRETLVSVLREQYASLQATEAVTQNIERLLQPNTFTVCTAHQPNLFTGPLYFIYKILHTIKLAEELTHRLPPYNVVPVYYMGSEDADFAELAHTYVGGKKIEWKKEQSGAVGRMVVDKTLLALIGELEGQLAVEPHGAEVVALFRNAYTVGKTVQEATFGLVNELYGRYGLVVLIPDHPVLKAQAKGLFADDLFLAKPFKSVQQTSERLAETYTAQAHPRPVNLFYLKDDVRERIEAEGDAFVVVNSGPRFTQEEIRHELKNHPERFSPNVVLRGIYQETILPNLAFVGGGGELAYWLQLKDLFTAYGVPYPVLVLRNSFLVVEDRWRSLSAALGLSVAELFQSEDVLLKNLALKYAIAPVLLNGKLEQATELFQAIQQQATAVDGTLRHHVAAMQTKSLKALRALEKKMIRAEKRKHTDEQRRLAKIKVALFPGGGLQERKENFSGFYAKWGRAFFDELYGYSLGLEQQFTVLIQC